MVRIAAGLEPEATDEQRLDGKAAMAGVYLRIEAVENALPRLNEIAELKRHDPAITEALPGIRRKAIMRSHHKGEYVKREDLLDRLAPINREFAK